MAGANTLRTALATCPVCRTGQRQGSAPGSARQRLSSQRFLPGSLPLREACEAEFRPDSPRGAESDSALNLDRRTFCTVWRCRYPVPGYGLRMTAQGWRSILITNVYPTGTCTVRQKVPDHQRAPASQQKIPVLISEEILTTKRRNTKGTW